MVRLNMLIYVVSKSLSSFIISIDTSAYTAARIWWWFYYNLTFSFLDNTVSHITPLPSYIVTPRTVHSCSDRLLRSTSYVSLKVTPRQLNCSTWTSLVFSLATIVRYSSTQHDLRFVRVNFRVLAWPCRSATIVSSLKSYPTVGHILVSGLFLNSISILLPPSADLFTM